MAVPGDACFCPAGGHGVEIHGDSGRACSFLNIEYSRGDTIWINGPEGGIIH